jgi:hypothetical protein
MILYTVSPGTIYEGNEYNWIGKYEEGKYLRTPIYHVFSFLLLSLVNWITLDISSKINLNSFKPLRLLDSPTHLLSE